MNISWKLSEGIPIKARQVSLNGIFLKAKLRKIF